MVVAVVLRCIVRYTLLVVVLFALIGCATTEESVDIAEADSTEREIEVGYGSQDKEMVTASVSSLSSEDITREDITHVEQLLNDIVGVTVIRTPAGGFSVRIRGTSSLHGSNEPLYIVDGMRVRPSPDRGLTGINPHDIASIDVLKGGSTAIYGTRGANGVVIIKTKRGH